MKKKTGIIFILFTSNNIICSLTTLKGLVLAWTSVRSKKLTFLETYVAILSLINYALKTHFLNINLRLKGFSRYKKLIIKLLVNSNFKFNFIQDCTSVPHNGCRLKRIKRI